MLQDPSQFIFSNLTLFELGGRALLCHFYVFLSRISLIKTPGLSNFVTLNFHLFNVFCVSFRAISCLDPSNCDFVKTK